MTENRISSRDHRDSELTVSELQELTFDPELIDLNSGITHANTDLKRLGQAKPTILYLYRDGHGSQNQRVRPPAPLLQFRGPNRRGSCQQCRSTFLAPPRMPCDYPFCLLDAVE